MIPTSSQSHDLRQQPLADPAPSGPDRAQDRPHSRRTTDAHRHRLFGASRQSPKEGLKQELASGYAAALVAAMSKSLAQMNKTPKVAAGVVQKMHSGRANSVRASKKGSALPAMQSGRAELRH